MASRKRLRQIFSRKNITGPATEMSSESQPVANSRRARAVRRQNLLEALESRHLMAGPQLIGIQPNEGELIDVDGRTVLHIAPRQLTMRFDASQQIDAATLAGIQITRGGQDKVLGTADDVVVSPGLISLGEQSNSQVVIRFNETLPDDRYQIRVNAVDDASRGIVALRNTIGEAFSPATAGARSQTVNFALQLGALVEAVVPQPVVRGTDGKLHQRLDEVMVYFNEDPLFVENDPTTGQPTARSAENPRFYQLLLTQETVSNADDIIFRPTRVIYDSGTNTARLIFATNLNELKNSLGVGVPLGGGTFRLRIGSAVDPSVDPTKDFILPPAKELAVSPSVTSSLRIDPNLAVTFRSKLAGEAASGRQVRFINSGNAGLSVALVGNDVVFNLGGATPTVANLATVVASTPAVDAVLAVTFALNGQADQGGTLVVPANITSLPALVMTGVGDTMTTSLNVGTFGTETTSLTFRENISPQPFLFDLPGSTSDVGRLRLPESIGNGLRQTINANFGVDSKAGITEVPFNFKSVFETVSGVAQLNQMSDLFKVRIREALSLWANYIGVQFRETADQGITFAVGDNSRLQAVANTQLTTQGVLDATLRIDPTFANSAMVFSNQVTFNTSYGEDLFRKAMAGIGFLLGLEQSTDLTTQSLMSLSSVFLNADINALTDLEPSFPGNYDIMHGQVLYRPDSIDADLYRFEVNLGSDDRVGTLTAETFAERLADSSSLDTSLRLFKEERASLVTDLGLGSTLAMKLTAQQSGALGNNARIDFLRTDRAAGDTAIKIRRSVDDTGKDTNNGVVIDVPRRSGAVSSVTVTQLINAINNDPYASTLFRAELQLGASSTDISGLSLLDPLLLSGGGLVQVARNDDYFSEDSFLKMTLSNGIYYVGVAASGNDSYDPTIANSGFGGKTEGKYQLLLKFEPQANGADTIRDRDSVRDGVPGTALDGDNDGTPGGAYNFWFQTRPLERTLEFTANGSAIVPGQTFTVTGSNGVVRRFEFVPLNGNVTPGNVAISYNPGASAGGTGSSTPRENLAAAVRTAINSVSTATGVRASSLANRTNVLTLTGERSFQTANNFRGLTVHGRTIFVDKAGSVEADGSQEFPFNNISNSNVPNAFDATLPGDIVRIVGNGGSDQNVSTATDNFSYKIGTTETGGGTLEDGRNMQVPRDVTVMIDAGAVFKLRNSAITVGSTSLTANRSGGALQVLGTPRLVDLNDPVIVSGTVTNKGVALRAGDGSVVFTSTRDRSADVAAAGNSGAPAPGNWGGIIFRRDFDQAEGRSDLEDEGIFLQTVNHADIRYGGGANILIESVQQAVNPIQMVNLRPNILFNEISNSANAAMSAAPDSFEETSYQEPRFQAALPFTADYNRVGPDIKRNRLNDNSINGLFVRVSTTSTSVPSKLTVAGRFDDIDIVHYIAENVIIAGTPGGSIQDGIRPDVSAVAAQSISGGSLSAGAYNYKVTFVDEFGFESLDSAATASITVVANSSISLVNLSPVNTSQGYVSRRIYRLQTNGTYRLAGELDAKSTSFIDDGSKAGAVLDVSRSGIRGRLDGSLVVDPGTIVKLTGSRIELGQGVQLLAEGTTSLPIVFTSVRDDRFGAGGSFDTNNDNDTTAGASDPLRGDWAGFYAGPTSSISFDNSTIAFGGGVSLIEGGQSRGFAALELQQADGRITNSRFEENADAQLGAALPGRNGRLAVTPATIFARFTQPVIVNNQFVDNRGSIIDIDSDSLRDNLRIDLGRQTGVVDRLGDLDDNYGPLVRRNTTSSFEEGSTTDVGGQLNGMEVRGGTLSSGSIWDDTDIAHVLFDSITVGNLLSNNGLQLRSRPDESLVIKLSGGGDSNSPTNGTGFTATGNSTSLSDRLGGTIHVLGLPGAPVVLTSLLDDTVGAGRTLTGRQQTDTNGDFYSTRPMPNDWRSLFFDQFSNDRNVAVFPEQELSTAIAPGLNGSINNAQYLGQLAASFYGGDEQLRLGFQVDGFLSAPADIDTYSFTGTAGTPVWLDIDKTTYNLDTVVEVLDSNGNVIARSNDSEAEVKDPSSLTVRGSLLTGKVGSLSRLDGTYEAKGTFGQYRDAGTVNSRDAGLSLTLPGQAGQQSTYLVRVRSASINPGDAQGGITKGTYSLQIRLREAQEYPGSVVRFADIRYANQGIHLQGLPSTSPLVGEVGENEIQGNISNNDRISGSANILGQRAQFVGDLRDTKTGAISLAGSLSSSTDVDFYQLTVNGAGLLSGTQLQKSMVFDVDYADGLNRPNTNISVFYDDGSGPRLVLFGADSNIADDQSGPLTDESFERLARGSVATGDAFIGPVSLPQGTYYVAITESGRIPTELINNPLVRRQPIDSIQRIIDDKVEFSGGSTASAPLIPSFVNTATSGWATTLSRAGDPGHQAAPTFNGSFAGGATDNQSYYFDRSVAQGVLTSNAFDLRGYAAADLPRLYFSHYYAPSSGDRVRVVAFSDQQPAPVTILNTLTEANDPLTWRQSVVSLERFAGNSGVVVQFIYDTNVANASGEGLYLDNFIVGFAERGELVTQASLNTTSFTVGTTAGQAGEYQLEMRPATPYLATTDAGVSLTATFDTNARQAREVTLVAPAGNQIQAGDRFVLNDGAISLSFEFNNSPSFNPSVVHIPFAPADTAAQVANRIIDTINSSAVQTAFNVRASSGLSNRSLAATDARVNLHGQVTGAFQAIDTVADAPTVIAGAARSGGGRDIQMPAILNGGEGDKNFLRTQGQVIIDSNRISDVRGIGIWSEPAPRPTDARDVQGNSFMVPGPLGNTASGVAMNLPVLNNSVLGGLTPSISIVNNIIDKASYAGIKVDGQTQPIELVLASTAAGYTLIDDGDMLVIDAAGTRVVFEFDDIGGAPTADGGSGSVDGNGVADGHIPINFRHRAMTDNNDGITPSTVGEIAVRIKQAIDGSILVTNNLARLVRSFVSPAISGANLGGVGAISTATPAVYIEGASNAFMGVGNYATIRRAPLAEAPQPFARVVNNTIYGNDGRESQFPVAGTAEPNDSIANAVDTKLNASHLGAYVTNAVLGDSTNGLSPDLDVDLYQVNLDAGDRLVADINTLAAGPDTVLRLFDSNGVPQQFITSGTLSRVVSVRGATPGYLAIGTPGANADDSYLDFTAIRKGTYYIGVSSLGNDSYDPLSSSGRKQGVGGIGPYQIGIEVYAPRNFILSVDDNVETVNNLTNTGTRGDDLIGTTFTITQVPDITAANGATVNGNQVTFQFTDNVEGVVNGNVAVPLDPDMRVQDIIRSISAAINRASVSVLANHADGRGPLGLSGPVPAAGALSLGGPDGAGLSGNLGVGTSELYSFIRNVAAIQVSPAAAAGGLRLTPDQATPQWASEADQLLAETGVLITQGSSSTVLNNVFINLHQSMVGDETSIAGFGVPGGNIYKAQTIVVTGNTFQFDDPRNSNIRAQVSSPTSPVGNAGISTGPSNINGGTTDFNQIAPNNVSLVENAGGDRFLPGSGSLIIDNAVDSLVEREAFAALKRSVGIPISNVLAPNRDNNGLLRSDNPNTVNPGGLGQNVFKDRGALDRADFVGPAAIIESPQDNDAEGIDADPSESFLQLKSGVYGEFRIQLRDTGDTSDPFVGSGIDDNTVVVPVIAGLRASGAAVTLFEGDRLLAEGVDYTFSYDATKNIIVLRPIAGLWRNDRAYRVSINNRDRLVGVAPAAGQVADGDTFTVVDSEGGRVRYEFDSGFQLIVPEVLQVTVPTSGSGFAGIADGDQFQITDTLGRLVVFEFDSNSSSLSDNVKIPFTSSDLPATVAAAIRSAIHAQASTGKLDVDVDLNATGPMVNIGSEAGTILNANSSNLIAAARSLGIQVPSTGTGINDGDLLTINDGNRSVTFEFDTAGGLANPNNVLVSLAGVTTAAGIMDAITLAMGSSSLKLSPVAIGNVLFLGLPANGGASVSSNVLVPVEISRTPIQGDTLRFTDKTGAVTTFEFVKTAPSNATHIPIVFNRLMSGDQQASAIAEALKKALEEVSPPIAGLSRSTIQAGTGGVVSIGGEDGLELVSLPAPPARPNLPPSPASSVRVIGTPGVTGSTSLTIFGPLILNVPIVGGTGIVPGSEFQLTDGVDTMTFRYVIQGTPPVPNITSIPYQTFQDAATIANQTIAAINASGLNITAVSLGNGQISLGRIQSDQYTATGANAAPLAPRRGIVNDGERVVIRQGNTTLTFEFDQAVGGGGVAPGSIPVRFPAGGTVDQVAAALAAAINSNRGNLDLTATATGGQVLIKDNPLTSTTVIPISLGGVVQEPTITIGGAPGGAVKVPFVANDTAETIRRAIVTAINDQSGTGKTTSTASLRGGATFYLENSQYVEGVLSNYYLPGVKDLSGQLLEPNRPDNTTQFTLLLPTIGLDYGDAPDPVKGVAGRYPTLLSNDGPRHVVSNEVRLGKRIDVDANGQPTATANGDDTKMTIGPVVGTLFAPTLGNGFVEVAFNVPSQANLGSVEGNTFTVSTGVSTVTFELDSDGIFAEQNYPVTIARTNPVTKAVLAQALVKAIENSPLNRVDNSSTVNTSDETVRIINDDEDGVVFTSQNNPTGVLNRFVPMPIEVYVTGTGVLEAWVDFNFDGDFDDAGEQVITRNTIGASFSNQTGERPLILPPIIVPSTAPEPTTATTTYARFRVSAEGGLTPTGLALSGEVEDYALTVLPGAPPTVTPSNSVLTYTVDEDTVLQARDGDGTLTPASANDNGALARIQDPNGDPVNVYREDVNSGPGDAPRVITTASGETAGSLVLFADGTFSFTPEPDFFGTAQFTFRVTDVKSNVATQLVSPLLMTVNLTVTPVNDRPFFNGTSTTIGRTVPEDQVTEFTLAELTNGYVPGPANELAQSLVIQSAGVNGQGFQTQLGGSLTILPNGNLQYTPPVNFPGPGPDRFTYVVADNPNGSNQLVQSATTLRTVTVNISAVNDSPLVVTDVFSGNEDEDLVMSISGAGGILSNDLPGPADEVAAGQTLSLVLSEFPKNTLRGGTVRLGTGNTTLIYTPARNFSGQDQFNYTVRDSGSPTQSSQGLVLLNVGGSNDAPVFVGIEGDSRRTSLTFDESKDTEQVFNFNLSSWFVDPEGDASRFTVTSSDASTVRSEILFDNASGVSTLRLTLPRFKPTTAGSPVTLNVVATNVGNGPSSSIQIPVTVNDTPDPPTVIGSLGTLSAQEDDLITRNLRDVFYDPDTGPLTYKVTRIGKGANEIVNPTAAQIAASTLIDKITFTGDTMTITLDANASGTADIEISASDGTFEVRDAFVLTVASVPDAPISAAEFYNVPVGAKFEMQEPTKGLLANDSDPDSDVFAGTTRKIEVDPSSVTQPSRGTVVVSANGTFTYTNTSGAAGDTDSFSYRPIDPTGRVGSLVTVTLNLGRSRYQNPIPGFETDVTADGVISPLDALRIINRIAAFRRDNGSIVSFTVAAITTAPPDYVDVNGDGVVTPLDALRVINKIAEINRSSRRSSEGESPQLAYATTVAYAAPATGGLPITNLSPVANVPVSTKVSSSSYDPFAAGFEVVDGLPETSSEALIQLHRSSQSDGDEATAVDEVLSDWFDATDP